VVGESKRRRVGVGDGAAGGQWRDIEERTQGAAPVDRLMGVARGEASDWRGVYHDGPRRARREGTCVGGTGVTVVVGTPAIWGPPRRLPAGTLLATQLVRSPAAVEKGEEERGPGVSRRGPSGRRGLETSWVQQRHAGSLLARGRSGRRGTVVVVVVVV
jgi:hypothetical protein